MVNHKKVLIRLWKDVFSVVEQQEVIQPNGSTGFEEITVLENEPCKLSFSKLQTTDQSDTSAKLIQATKLFCDNLITIKAGSKIIVTRQGRKLAFSQSGNPGLFSEHQEIVLVPFSGWA